MLSEKDPKELELKKHVGSIHCSNTLSLLQRKISNVLLYHAFDELLSTEEHIIPIKTLCSLIGYSSHDYDSIKKALKALISTVIEWNLLGDKKDPHQEDWNASSILASVGIRNGLCTYSYSSHLKKLLFMPEMYGRINISVQAKFKSNYALALYENCIRYQNLSHTRWFALSTFRKLMGVPDDKYVIFRDFKRRVIDKSIEEINRYAEIQVEPEIERQGHQVNRIRFKLHKNVFQADKNEDKPAGEGAVAELRQILLSDFGLSQTQADQILARYEAAYIQEKIAIVINSAAFKNGRVRNYAAYLKSALSEDFVTVKQRSILVDSYEKTKQQAAMTDRFYLEESQKVDRAYDNFSLERQAQLLVAFETHLTQTNNHFMMKKYRCNGLENQIVKSVFRHFLREQYPSLLPAQGNLEQFLAAGVGILSDGS